MNAIVLDVDGTLVDSRGAVVPVVRDALVRAWHSSAIILASGRPPSGVRYILSQIGVTGPFVALNGAVIADSDGSGKCLTRSFSKCFLRTIKAVCTQFKPGIAAIFAYSAKQWMAEGQTRAIKNEAALVGCEPDKRLAGGEIFGCQAIKLTVVCSNNAARSQFCSQMKRRVGQACVIETSKHNYVEITRLGVNKGHAIKELLRTNEWEHTVSVGDGVNDISMFKATALSYAMPWADETVKKAAQRIVPKPGYKNLAEIIVSGADL